MSSLALSFWLNEPGAMELSRAPRAEVRLCHRPGHTAGHDEPHGGDAGATERLRGAARVTGGAYHDVRSFMSSEAFSDVRLQMLAAEPGALLHSPA